MRLFKKWGKWMPIQTYVFNFDSYLLIGRVEQKTGEIEFKSKEMRRGVEKFELLDANIQLDALFQRVNDIEQ